MTRSAVGWADVATKQDLAVLREVMVTRDMLHAEINRLLLWLFPTLLTALALVFAVAKLT